jgi:hypothetical protein
MLVKTNVETEGRCRRTSIRMDPKMCAVIDDAMLRFRGADLDQRCAYGFEND